MMTDYRQSTKPTDSLVIASLDMGRVLADRDGVTFRVHGMCMYPTVRPGDVLRIQSRTVAEVAVGDIAVWRGPDYLFGHRVIGKNERDKRPYIITRPDRSRNGSDAPKSDEDLLGVVVTITRNGKPVPLRPTPYPWPVRCYYATRLALTEAAERTRLWLGNALPRAQNYAIYRKMARAWLAMARPRITYAVQMPLNAKLGESVYRRLTPDEFDVQKDWRERRVERWTLALHWNGGRQPAAVATFVRNSSDEWRVAEMSVRLRYRGMGLDDKLVRQAKSILARCGKSLS